MAARAGQEAFLPYHDSTNETGWSGRNRRYLNSRERLASSSCHKADSSQELKLFEVARRLQLFRSDAVVFIAINNPETMRNHLRHESRMKEV
jgi:hypothetical protein